MRDLFSVKDLNIIVTGAAKGNGKTISEYLFNYGANIIAIDIIPIKIIKKSNINNFFKSFNCDLSKKTEVINVCKKILKINKKIDVLINNAGVSIPNNYDLDNFQKTLNINLIAPYLFMHEISKNMIKNKKGSIINITSLSQKMAFSNNPSYNASKAGLSKLTYSMALDLGKHNIRVNNVLPGYIKTDMTKKSFNDKKMYKIRNDRNMLGRWGKSSDLIGAIVFLSSNASNYITSSTISVDGGFSKKGI